MKVRGKLPVVFFCHGGGFCLFSNTSLKYSALCDQFADEGTIVVNVDYRRAPEHPFPAAFLDSFNALKWLASDAGKAALPSNADLSRVVMAGDSAGGNLALVCTQLVRDNLDSDGVTPLPLTGLTIVHSVLIYPYMILKTPTESFKDPTLNMILVPPVLTFFEQSYLPDKEMYNDR
jgi:acetyl esterase